MDKTTTQQNGEVTASSRFRSLLFLISIYTAFFASGASSLFAEVTWNRMLIVVVGNSMSAAAMIVVVFMAGLGIGSFAGGKLVAQRKRSLVPYVVLELAIGAYILLSPSLFEILARVFTMLSEVVPNRSMLTLVRILVSLAALFLPAFLMGATFPAMVSGAALDGEKKTARTGFLYSINTLGAAVGCFVAGYHLLFEFGVQTTLTCAFGLNCTAASCAFLGQKVRGFAATTATSGESRSSDSAADVRRRRFLYAANFAIGFVALAYEVLLTRLGILYLGNVASVFALVLTAFLLGTGISAILGTWIYGLLDRFTIHAAKLFGVVSLGAAVFVLGTPYLLLNHSAARSSADLNLATVLGLLIAPTILIGALLPIAIRMIDATGRREATRAAAALYSLNTAGGLLGAGIANHILVPLVGLQGALTVLALICAAIGVINLSGREKGRLRWSAVAVTVGLLAVVPSVLLPHLMDLYAEKIAKATRAHSVDVRLVHEGRAANVTVLDQQDPKFGTYRDMYLNGVEEASTRFWHAQLFKLLGTLPVMVHESDRPKNALVIAFGAGITAGSVLASEEVSSLDVVDLNPDIEGINNLFTDVNGDVFHQPRFHFYNDDGRNYLVTSAKTYDLIICDSTHPRAYDSWILYTSEFYRSVKKRLASDGVFAQWVPVGADMRGQLFAIHLNTFRSVFPNATFWYVYGSDQAFLLATPRPLTLDADRLQRKLDRLAGWFRARDYQIDTVARLGGFFWLDQDAMSRLIGNEARINTDDLHYFDKQSAVMPVPPEQRLPHYQASVAPYITETHPKFQAAVRDQQYVAQLVTRFNFYGDAGDLVEAYCFMPDNGNVRFWMSREFSTDRLPEPAQLCATRARLHQARWAESSKKSERINISKPVTSDTVRDRKNRKENIF